MLNNTGTQKIETERLILRKFSFDDCSDMLKYWVSDERIQKSYGEPVYKTKAEVKSLLDKYISGYESKNFYRWAIAEKSSGICIGQIAFFLVDSKNNFSEIEYCI